MDKKRKSDNDIMEMMVDMKHIKMNENEQLFSKILKKIEKIENKLEEFIRMEIKLERLNKKLDEIIVEKDYIIDNLKDEIRDLRVRINEVENDNVKKYDDYFS